MVSSNSSNSTTSQSMTDPEAARRMAAVAESQQALAQEQYSLGREIYEPYEREMVAANRALIDPNRQLVQSQMQEESRLTPLRGQVTEAGLKDTMTDIESTRGLKDQIIANQTADMQAAEGVGAAFFKKAMDGVDPSQRMGEAQTNVAQGFAKSQSTLERDISRLGGNMSDASNQAIMSNLAVERAKAVGGARTGAARSAEDESFNRLAGAMQVKGQYQLPGVASTATTATGAMPTTQGAIQLGGYTLQSGVDKSLGFSGAAIQANQAGMQALTQGSSKSSGWGFLSSTERIKHSIQPLPINPCLIHELMPVSFCYNGEAEEQFGFIAEEMFKVLPELVVKDDSGRIIGYNPGSLLSLITAEMQNLNSQVKKLKKEIEHLKEEKGDSHGNLGMGS